MGEKSRKGKWIFFVCKIPLASLFFLFFFCLPSLASLNSLNKQTQLDWAWTEGSRKSVRVTVGNENLRGFRWKNVEYVRIIINGRIGIFPVFRFVTGNRILFPNFVLSPSLSSTSSKCPFSIFFRHFELWRKILNCFKKSFYYWHKIKLRFFYIFEFLYNNFYKLGKHSTKNNEGERKKYFSRLKKKKKYFSLNFLKISFLYSSSSFIYSFFFCTCF